MSLSMYDASVTVFIRQLSNLSLILDKAVNYAESKKIDPAVLVNARLAPDMFPLSRQIQSASDNSKGCTARLAGIEVPSFPDNEVTFQELKARIEKTISFLQSINPAAFNDSEEREITLKVRGQEMKFKGKFYLLYYALPNFYFHTTTAYDILRHNGLDIGKRDYLGSA